jgi:hypothetical protein
MIDYRGTVLNLPPEVLGQVDLAVHTRFTATTPPLAVRIKIPLRSGRMPTLTFSSCSRPAQNMPG